MLKIYIAAPYPLRAETQAVMRELEAGGYEVTSTWLRSDDPLDNEHARLDLNDIARADLLLAFNPEAWKDKGTGGRHVELGYAIGLQMPVVIVGVRSNIFHYLDTVSVVEHLDEVYPLLQAIRDLEV